MLHPKGVATVRVERARKEQIKNVRLPVTYELAKIDVY